MSACPYCLTPICDTDDTTTCESCGAVYHGECWDEADGCCVRECRRSRPSLDVEVSDNNADRLSFSREAVESARPHRAVGTNNPCLRCGAQLPDGMLYCKDCTPELEEGPDSRNLGPILAMLLVTCVLLAWLVTASIAPSTDAPPPPEATSRVSQ